MVSWIEDYDDRTVDEVHAAVDRNDPTGAELAELLAYERENKDRVTVIEYLESLIEPDGDGVSPGNTTAEPDDPVADRLADLDERLVAVESAFTEKIQDVRERVIQVKRETDAKASRDHDHPGVADRLDRIADAVEQLEADLAALEDTALTGFRNYEAVLEFLTDTAEDHEGKLDRLAAGTLDLRDSVDEMRSAHARRAAVEQLAAEAVRHGARDAECESCGNSVPVGMLSSPRCPHCGETFSEFEPKRGLLGTNRLLTGTHPALEAAQSDGVGSGDGPTIDDVLGAREIERDPADGGVDSDGEIEAEDLIERDG